ncbi:MAG: hypothetical protein HS108_13100 [Planctomycetes bacterium]|jgi:disulfide oxidoreductase YuzD|nr:hypothetical protein [Planctomycetota bacterium]MCL4731634.1 hypothetical protein [Planctomycetota bacterium]
MKTILTMLAAAVLAVPLFAQDAPKEPAKETAKEAPKAEITEEGRKLLEDVKRVYAKYYEIVLAKIKADESYKAEEVWDTAVKEAKNAAYKDSKEWSEAVLKMKKADRVFSREMNDFVNKTAKEHAEAVRKWAEESQK